MPCEWKHEWSEQQQTVATADYAGSGEILIRGKVDLPVTTASTLGFIAASPPQRGSSYTGSGLPYANAEMAYGSTSSVGRVSLDAQTGQFAFRIPCPSGYYSGLGTVYVKPHVQLMLSEGDRVVKTYSINVGDGVPFRLLTYPPPPGDAPRTSAMFYEGTRPLPVQTQESLFRKSEYPRTNKMPANFWGEVPPH